MRAVNVANGNGDRWIPGAGTTHEPSRSGDRVGRTLGSSRSEPNDDSTKGSAPTGTAASNASRERIGKPGVSIPGDPTGESPLAPTEIASDAAQKRRPSNSAAAGRSTIAHAGIASENGSATPSVNKGSATARASPRDVAEAKSPPLDSGVDAATAEIADARPIIRRIESNTNAR